MKRLFLAVLLVIFLTGCAGRHWAPHSPLPTPTTVIVNELPIEIVRQGGICLKLETDYQFFVLKSVADWNNLLRQLSANNSAFIVEKRYFVAAGAGAVDLTDFTTQRLLLALRTCYTDYNHTLAIDRVVQVSDEHLFVYLELRNPDNGSYLFPEASGYYYFASIPWSLENADEPEVEVVAYPVFIYYGQPVE